MNLDGSSAQAWRKSLLVAIYRLMHNMERDNFDARRYGEAARNAFREWLSANDRLLQDGDTGDVVQLFLMLKAAFAKSRISSSGVSRAS